MDLFFVYGLAFLFLFSAVNFIVLARVPAPYGRHARKGWGPEIKNAPLAWVLMEAPCPILFTYFFFQGGNSRETAALILFAMFMAHYVYRSFIFPFRMRGAKPKPVLTFIAAVLFNMTNGVLNGWAIGVLATHLNDAWLMDPRLWIGVLLFATGYAINHHSDAILRGLRKPGETGYKIPHGGFYRWISSPNYFGEIIEWAGFALAAWTLPALAFLLFTASNLMPRALTHHRWYHEKFEDYPKARKAILPGLL